MTITSVQFLAFAAVTALAYLVGRAQWWRQAVLLAANLAFLASFSQNPAAFVPLAGFLLTGWLGLRLVQRGPSAARLWALLASVLVLFFWLKKYAFFTVLPFLEMPYLTIGLSYIFFRVVHLIVDGHAGMLPGQVGPLNYLNYTLNFTTLVSGPIQRYQDFHQQREASAATRIDLIECGIAGERIMLGFFKATVMAPLVYYGHQQALAGLGDEVGLLLRVAYGAAAAGSYTIYLYLNFSGYTDIVIGVGRFLGFRLPENFNSPFLATNFLDFWSRWHISLSNWLKTYLHNPTMITLMRRFPAPSVEPLLGVFSFFVTFFLAGVWHGQSSIFVVLGLLLGLGVSVNKLVQVLMQRKFGRKGTKALVSHWAYRLGARGLTFAWISLCLFAFWCDWERLDWFADRLGPPGLILAAVALVATMGVGLSVGEWLRQMVLAQSWRGQALVGSRYLRVSWSSAQMVIVMAAMVAVDGPGSEIVYKTF